MRRLLLPLICLALQGQEPPQRSTADLLASSEPSDQAWGAQLAANYRQSQYVPRIVALLRDPGTRLAALDALIRLRADVSTDALEPYLKTNFNSVVILLARNLPKHSGLLLRFIEDPSIGDQDWAIANSLIASAPPAGYASRLWSNWQFQVQINVNSPGHRAASSIGMAGFCGDGGPQVRFPAIASYIINPGVAPGETVLVLGAHPFSYVASNCGRFEDISRSAYILDYLRQISHYSATPPSTEVEFTTSAQYRRWGANLQAQMRRFLSGLSRALNLGAVRPRVEVVINDRRVDKTSPLPALDLRF